MKANEFNDKKKYNEVSGVSAYVDNNIEIFLNDIGLYEERLIDESKDVEPSVLAVSPQFNENINENDVADCLFKDIKGIHFDKRIGYYKSLYVGYVKEGNYRVNGSSGGMGTWIFKALLESNLIDGVIHVKESIGDDKDILFEYGISKTNEEIIAGSKTKYFPVELSRVLKVVKDNPGRYAVVGIPSFIMAIRLLSKHDPIIHERIKYTVGLICGHQKSAQYTESMAWQVGFKKDDIIKFDYRKKLPNRPASQYGIEVTGLKNGKEETVVKPVSELFGQDWGMGFFKALASDFTDDVFNETADITLGDAWLKEYTDDYLGNNVVIVRNQEIDELIKTAIDNEQLHMDVVSVETVFESQAAHYRHTHDELAYRIYANTGWSPKKRVASSNKFPYFRKKIQDLRIELSTQSHIQFLEAKKRDDFDYFVDNMSPIVKRYRNLYRVYRVKRLGIKGTIDKIMRKLRLRK